MGIWVNFMVATVILDVNTRKKLNDFIDKKEMYRIRLDE